MGSSVNGVKPQDPTRPPTLSVYDESDDLVLNAIMGTPDRRVAVINGQLFHVGDQFGGIRVLTIDANTVELEGPAGRVTLVLLSFPLQPVIIKMKE